MSARTRLLGIATGTVIGLAVLGSAVAVTLDNGSFEAPDAPEGAFVDATTTLPGWTVSAGNIDVINDGYWQASAGSQSIDLTGNAAATIQQTLATVVGANYVVTFDLSGNPEGGDAEKSLKVSATGTAEQTYTFNTATAGNTKTDMKWQEATYTFVATSTSTTLTFQSLESGLFGPALDNVVVTETLATATDCKKGGWATMTDASGNRFKNQGDCVSHFATGGRNPGAVTD